MTQRTIWLVFTLIFAVLAYAPFLTGAIKDIPLWFPLTAACACLLSGFGTLGAWAKGEQDANTP